MRRRRHDLRRNSPNREPKKRILIVCEGIRTEASYFSDLRAAFRNPLIDIEIDSKGGVPKTLVERAVAHKKAAERDAHSKRDDFLRYDEVWCVFDVDEHPNILDAQQQARDNKINLAISNPCFELWALIHLQEHSTHEERDVIAHLLRAHFPSYRKVLPFNQIHSGYHQAVRRARNLEQRRREADDVGGNPSTGVYRLTETIREGGKPIVPKE